MQHTSDFLSVSDDGCCVFFPDDLYPLTEDHLRLQFVVRAIRESQVMNVFRGMVASEAFSDVGRHRYSRLANLVTEHRLIIAGKPFRHSVTPLGEIHRLLPHEEFAEGRYLRHPPRERTGRADQLLSNFGWRPR